MLKNTKMDITSNQIHLPPSFRCANISVHVNCFACVGESSRVAVQSTHQIIYIYLRFFLLIIAVITQPQCLKRKALNLLCYNKTLC